MSHFMGFWVGTTERELTPNAYLLKEKNLKIVHPKWIWLQSDLFLHVIYSLLSHKKWRNGTILFVGGAIILLIMLDWLFTFGFDSVLICHCFPFNLSPPPHPCFSLFSVFISPSYWLLASYFDSSLLYL